MSYCSARDVGLRLLLEHTDICASVLTCGSDSLTSIRRRVRKCDLPTPESIRMAQSLFGAFRRTYASLLRQHPSPKLDLRALLARSAVENTGSRDFELVMSRCRQPLWPTLRVLPASLLPAEGPSIRARALVFEHCVPGTHLADTPRLDVRERVPAVRHVIFRGPGSNDTSRAISAFGTHLVRTRRSGVQLADRTLFLFPAGVTALASTPPAEPQPQTPSEILRAYASFRGGDPQLRNQHLLQRELREHWTTIANPVDPWTRADSASAALNACVVQSLRLLDSVEGAGGTVVLHAAEGSSPLAVLAARSALKSAAHGLRDGQDGATKAWQRLLDDARHHSCMPRFGNAGRLCGSYHASGLGSVNAHTPGSRRQMATKGSRGDVDSDDSAASWPTNVSSVGFCGVTNEGVEGSCARGDRGSWNTRVHRIKSFADCVGRCTLCQRLPLLHR